MVSQIERRLSLQGDTDATTVSVSIVVPVGGGVAKGTATFSSLSGIDAILGVTVTNTSPAVTNLNAPQATASGNTVGLSVNGGTGTTVTLSVSVWGH